ncbi:hypothetical protein GUJ93_ZPchr0458g22327 [Zizania palustris]|uniref:Uncharacterized protein n=1 Tax=Zizania palustris TaxID=103762 RepID=A0A8J5RE30_ZIZPA|nr:hypothetical protein GUJ93_ZPchr0458g22292 [Zizania palustris]KAG8043722.1 hypothetical protein GUJ93_ZPchr0458g22327 [Zizania palustris]
MELWKAKLGVHLHARCAPFNVRKAWAFWTVVGEPSRNKASTKLSFFQVITADLMRIKLRPGNMGCGCELRAASLVEFSCPPVESEAPVLFDAGLKLHGPKLQMLELLIPARKGSDQSLRPDLDLGDLDVLAPL